MRRVEVFVSGNCKIRVKIIAVPLKYITALSHYKPTNQMLNPNGHISDLLSGEAVKGNVRQEKVFISLTVGCH